MARKRTPVVVLAALALALPATALAGSVTHSAGAITYRAESDANAPEDVGLTVDSGRAVLRSERGFSSRPDECNQDSDTVIDCDPAAGWVVWLLGFDDSVSVQGGIGAMTIEVHGGAGGDTIGGGVNADKLFGDEGADSLFDEPGDDVVNGGPGDDLIHPGSGRDDIFGGPGRDTAYYNARTAGVTITLDDRADDGEAGEGDNVHSDFEDAHGGSGPDRLVGTDGGNDLIGNEGDDSLTGLGSEDRLDAGEGNDFIDSRDGGFDSVDCGPGFDTVVADQDDSLTGCESVSVPDADSDGFVPPADCDNTDPTRHPGAFEILGDGIDQDCDGIDAPRPRLVNPVSSGYDQVKHPKGIRLTVLKIKSMHAGDKVTIRCKGRGCPYKKRTRTGRAGQRTLNLLAPFKKRNLRPGVRIEIRITRPQWVGKYVLLRVIGRKLALDSKCIEPDSTKLFSC
jgi:Ca2+-binding RTX toxin-like protein